MPSVVVLGAAGGLGRILTRTLRSRNFKVIGADLTQDTDAPAADQVLLDKLKIGFHASSWESTISNFVYSHGLTNVDAVLNVAGGFAMATAAQDNLLEATEQMVNSSIYSSMVAARLASVYLNPGGLLLLPGAAAAGISAPAMLPYIPIKTAVHNLAHCLSQTSEAGLPADAKVAVLAPVTLDTPGNRAAMPDVDKSSWTPCDVVADKIGDWVEAKSAKNGTVYTLRTTGNGSADAKTDFVESALN